MARAIYGRLDIIFPACKRVLCAYQESRWPADRPISHLIPISMISTPISGIILAESDRWNGFASRILGRMEIEKREKNRFFSKFNPRVIEIFQFRIRLLRLLSFERFERRIEIESQDLRIIIGGNKGEGRNRFPIRVWSRVKFKSREVGRWTSAKQLIQMYRLNVCID